ncbi:hypothetical protein AM571_PA00119 (plasmid) [Rhizobium etli 8C-3]|uniref:Uncharacterized protein n=1 Tax=Rhizobium etli 8C-3 TaxID=538025 RepID=A0A1L5PA30_RHIET|nr:hypothetical protein AM571_PA00119 [Rhizobium etli 8C-3]
MRDRYWVRSRAVAPQGARVVPRAVAYRRFVLWGNAAGTATAVFSDSENVARLARLASAAIGSECDGGRLKVHSVRARRTLYLCLVREDICGNQPRNTPIDGSVVSVIVSIEHSPRFDRHHQTRGSVH